MTDYELRYSAKAKRLQIRVSAKGVEVIIPQRRRVNLQTVQAFLDEKKNWIEKNRQRYSQPPVKPTLPTEIKLTAVNQIWQVQYLATNSKRVGLVINAEQQLSLVGNIADETLCFHMLRNWLLQNAKKHLSVQLNSLSQQTGLFYRQLKIRSNSTRWGSCSAQQNISLCCKLMFLPMHLMQHILLHELCHTKIMHHGKSFWRLLEQFDPNAKFNSRSLRLAAQQYVPNWI